MSRHRPPRVTAGLYRGLRSVALIYLALAVIVAGVLLGTGVI